MTNRRSARVVAGIVAAAVAGLALAGCAPSGETTESPGTTTVSWWAWNPDEATAKTYIDAFEAEHPEITIDYRFIQYSDYANTVQLGLQSGSGPDVFGTQVGALTSQFAPLAEDLAPVLQEQLGADWKDKISAWDQLMVDGKLVGSPWMTTGGGLMWANQTMLDELGLTFPTDYAGLLDFCAAVKAAGKACVVQGAKDAWQNLDVFQIIANQIAPGEFYKALAGDADFDDATFVQAFETWKKLFDDGVFQDGALGATGYPDANDAFKKQEAALIFFGTWQNADTTKTRMKQYVETYGEQIADVIFMPYFPPALVPNGKTGTLFGGPDVGFAVSDSSKVKDAAHTFVMWLTAETGGQEIMAKRVIQPALLSVSPDMSDVITDEQRAALSEQSEPLANLIGARQIADADVQTALGDALSAVASGQQTPQDAAKAVQAAIDASLK